MALYYWSLNRGQKLVDVQASSTPPTADFIVTVDLTTNTPTRSDVAQALNMITTFLLSHNYPPA